MFKIVDTENARLVCTLWDSNVSHTADRHFLGEVMIAANHELLCCNM